MQQDGSLCMSSGEKVPGYNEILLDESPFMSLVFSDSREPVACNAAAVSYFGFNSKEDCLRGFLPLLESHIPAFQPDASPTIPLSARFDYVIANGSIEFETEITIDEARQPLGFFMKKVERGESFVIVCYIRDNKALSDARSELSSQDYLMRQVNRAATKLMAAEPENFDAQVPKILKSVAQGTGANHLALWRNYEYDSKTYARELHLWDADGLDGDSTNHDVGISSADMPDWYEVLSKDKRFTEVCRGVLGGERERVVPRGTKVYSLIPIFLQKQHWGFISLCKSRDARPFTNIEERSIQSSGILVVAALMRNEITQNLIIAREEAMAGARAKSDFLSKMSHEIRTPLNAILGMTAISRKSADMAQVQNGLEKIELASQQLLSIINDILDMSKIESGKLELDLSEVDFEKTVRSIADVMKVRFDEKSLDFSLVFESEFDRKIVTDELRLSQLLLNLLSNALKFTPSGGRIELRAGRSHAEDERELLRISVSDTGIGISDEQKSRLFRSFEQADPSTTRKFGGTGLGLAICRSIVVLMGGNIWVESILGEGSSFIFEVPFSWGAAVEEASEPAASAEPPKEFRFPGRRILLVEDVEINREIILAVLEGTELTIDCAENGLQAVELMRERPEDYDLLFMDIQMPEMDGYEATRQIRAMDNEHAKNVPIIAMTANAFTEDVRRCLEAGMNDHVAKPIDINIIMDKLCTYLQ